jgi:Ca2+-binding RTX toxin-like protein
MLYGMDGDDILVGGAGADRLDGKASSFGTNEIDLASYADSASRVTASLTTKITNPETGGDAAGDIYEDIDGFIGTNFDDILEGNKDAVGIFDGGAGDDQLLAHGPGLYVGGAGNDTLDFSAGDGFRVVMDLSKTVTAPFDDDALWVPFSVYSRASVNGLLEKYGGVASVGEAGMADGLLAVGIENLTGTFANDELTGDDRDNQLVGSLGDDVLRGGAGDDILLGDSGIDMSYGEDGNDLILDRDLALDVIDGGKGDDLIRLTALSDTLGNAIDGGEGNDTIDMSFTTETTIDLATGVVSQWSAGYLASIENAYGSDRFVDSDDIISGTAGRNELHGQRGDDLLDGRAGNDLLEGGDGDDTLIGGAGADRIDGGDGFDTASYAGSTAGVGINLFFDPITHLSPVQSGGDAEGDVLSSIDSVIGSSFADTIKGFALSSAAETLAGGGGDDTLMGFGGADILIGGAGADLLYGVGSGLGAGPDGAMDTFRYEALADSTVAHFDTIVDFEVGIDKIDLRVLGTQIGGWSSTNRFELMTPDTQVHTAKGQVFYDPLNTAIFINTDNGFGESEMVIKLQNPTGVLSANDFLF